jgi:hypothetical protein
MSVETDITEAVADYITADRIGILGEADRLAVLIAAEKDIAVYRDRSRKKELMLQLRIRGDDQEDIVNELTAHVNALRDHARAFVGADYQVLSIRPDNMLSPVVQDERGRYIYLAMISVTFFTWR